MRTSTKTYVYGETKFVTVFSATERLIVVLGDHDREAFILAGHGIKDLPKKDDKGKIVFTEGGPTGGYWYFIANTK